MRDYIYSIILDLQHEFQQYRYAAEMAHLDAVCVTAQLYFNSTNLIDDAQAY